MKFVSYRSLARCFNVSFEKLDKDVISQIKAAAENYFKTHESLICDNKTLSLTDVYGILDGLNTPSNVVFHDWIKSDKAISVLLKNESENYSYDQTVTNEKYRSHAFEKQFYRFLTPFVFPIIEQEILKSLAKQDLVKVRFFLQYADFIQESQKIKLHQEVNSHLQSKFSHLLLEFGKDDFGEKEIAPKKIAKTWNRIIEQVNLFTSRDLVDILNLLDKQFYALRVKYIDTVKEVIIHPNIDPFTFKKISEEVNRLELKDSHKSQVRSFTQQSQSRFYKKQKTTLFNKALLSNPLFYIAAILLGIIVVLTVPFDFKKSELPKTEKISGIDSLSIEEVKKTDSLLAYKADSTLFQSDDMPVPVALPDFILLDNSSDIHNKNVLDLYESMLTDYKIQQNSKSLKCTPLEKNELELFNYENVERIQEDFANHTLINESSEDCYLILFENKKNGATYGEFVAAGDALKIKIVKNWRVIFYTGKDFSPFNPLKSNNKGYGNLQDAKKIDSSFNTHFCQMDYSNFQVLSFVYRVASEGKTTRLINNSNGALELKSNSIIVSK